MFKELLGAVVFLAVLTGCGSSDPTGTKTIIKQFCQETAINATNNCDKSVKSELVKAE